MSTTSYGKAAILLSNIQISGLTVACDLYNYPAKTVNVNARLRLETQLNVRLETTKVTSRCIVNFSPHCETKCRPSLDIDGTPGEQQRGMKTRAHPKIGEQKDRNRTILGIPPVNYQGDYQKRATPALYRYCNAIFERAQLNCWAPCKAPLVIKNACGAPCKAPLNFMLICCVWALEHQQRSPPWACPTPQQKKEGGIERAWWKNCLNKKLTKSWHALSNPPSFFCWTPRRSAKRPNCQSTGCASNAPAPARARRRRPALRGDRQKGATTARPCQSAASGRPCH